MSRRFGLQWHVTNNCDQRCKHCYIWQKYELEGIKAEPTPKQCRKVIDSFLAFCHEMGVDPYFSITGGDPLLYPFIWDLLEMLHHKNLSFTILGNPFHLTVEVLKRLQSLGCLSYQMSLDGLQETHDSMRKHGSFNSTLAALPLLKDAGIRSMIMATVSLLNYREIPDVARLCVEHGVGGFAFARYCPQNGDVEWNINPQLYRQFLEDMWSVYCELGDKGTTFSLKDHLWVALLHEKGLYKLKGDKGVVFDGCNCGISHMTLLPNGTIYACRRFSSPIGVIDTGSFKDAFFSESAEKYRQIDKLSGCKDCELLCHCRGCHAVSAGTMGDYFSKDPQCWRC